MPKQQGFETSANGSLKVTLRYSSFSHIVLGSQGVTFHWHPTNNGPFNGALARARLANLMEDRNIDSVQGNHYLHDYFHFDVNDGYNTPELHSHLSIGSVEENTAQQHVTLIGWELTKAGFLTNDEYHRLLLGMQAFRQW